MQLLYTIVAVLHTIGAVAGMGPSLAMHVMIGHLRHHPEALPTLGPIMGRIAMFPRHGGLLQLVTGLILVALSGWGMLSQAWIWGSIVLVLVAAAVSATQLEPVGKRFVAIVRSGQLAPDEIKGLADKLERAGRVTLACLIIILVLMVVRP